MTGGNLKDYNGVGLLFPSEYLCADDLRERDVTVVIEKVIPRHELRREDNTTEEKPIVLLRGKQKKWVLNKTNAKSIAKLHGKPMDWEGKAIAIYPTTCKAFGEVHDCIRVRPTIPTRKAGK